MTAYASAGVNIELGDDASKILYNASKLTWENRKGKLGEVIELFSHFSGLRAISVSGLPPGTFMNLGFDGIGTKVEVCERMSNHTTAAYDLFAMVCDDAVVRGAEPVLIGSILDVRSLGDKEQSYINFVKQLAIGYINAAKEAGVAVVNGEVAELGARVQGYGDFNYNWGAGLVWFAKKERMFTGREVKVGDYLVGLREEGFRSNGLSLTRKILTENYGPEWHKYSFMDRNIGEQVMHPSRIYSGTVVEMFGGYNEEPQAEVHAVAHITGGGLPGKLGRILKPSGLGAKINSPFEPCSLMTHCQDIGKVTNFDAYRAWNMGQGMVIVTPDPEAVMKVASSREVESKVIGQVTEVPGIRIIKEGRELYFPSEE